MNKKIKYISTGGHTVENTFAKPETWLVTKPGHSMKILRVTRSQIQKTYIPKTFIKD